MSRWIALAALSLASCAQTPEMLARDQADSERALNKALAGRTPGTPVDCIPNDRTQNAQIIDHRSILYSQTGRVIWRNDVGESCPSLRQNATLIVEVYGSQICRNDRFRVVEPGQTIPSAYCLFGRFTPYTKAGG